MHIDTKLAVIASMRAREGVRGHQITSIVMNGGNHDPMLITDRRIEAEEEAKREIEEYRKDIEEARDVCRGVRTANWHNPRWGEALELRYIEAMTWKEVSQSLGVSQTQARYDARAALEWLDSVGIARAVEYGSEN